MNFHTCRPVNSYPVRYLYSTIPLSKPSMTFDLHLQTCLSGSLIQHHEQGLTNSMDMHGPRQVGENMPEMLRSLRRVILPRFRP